jgi:hypothetical protein
MHRKAALCTLVIQAAHIPASICVDLGPGWPFADDSTACPAAAAVLLQLRGVANCPFYMGTGACKFRERCLYHHPPAAMHPACVLNGTHLLVPGFSFNLVVHFRQWSACRSAAGTHSMYAGTQPPAAMHPACVLNGRHHLVLVVPAPRVHDTCMDSGAYWMLENVGGC